MSKYIDQKLTIWQRLHFNDNADMNDIIKQLESGSLPNELCGEENGFVECEILYDTEEFIRSDENDGQSTIEVYSEEKDTTVMPTMIWDNSYESEIKRNIPSKWLVVSFDCNEHEGKPIISSIPIEHKDNVIKYLNKQGYTKITNLKFKDEKSND